MAATLTKQFFSGDIARGAEQGIVTLIGRLALNTYATGGIAVDFANVHADAANANIIGGPVFTLSEDATLYFRYDSANSKVLAYLRSDESEVSNATDLSATAKRCGIQVSFRVSTDASASVTL